MDLRQLRDDPTAWEILQARARELAAEESSETAQIGEEILTFRLGDACYGVEARLVREVQVLAGCTPLPGAPPFLLGLVNLRGRLFAALDLRPLLTLPPTPPRPGAVLLVVSASGLDVALLADEVVEIQRGDTALAPSIASVKGQAIPWVRGIDRNLTVHIDLGLFLTDARLVINTVDAGPNMEQHDAARRL